VDEAGVEKNCMMPSVAAGRTRFQTAPYPPGGLSGAELVDEQVASQKVGIERPISVTSRTPTSMSDRGARRPTPTTEPQEEAEAEARAGERRRRHARSDHLPPGDPSRTSAGSPCASAQR
jgi:hypothetical protein